VQGLRGRRQWGGGVEKKRTGKERVFRFRPSIKQRGKEKVNSDSKKRELGMPRPERQGPEGGD